MMKKIDCILLMAGQGLRANLPINKTLYEINKIPLYMYSLIKFNNIEQISHIYLVVNEKDYEQVCYEVAENYPETMIIKGGITRFESVKAALKVVSQENDIIIHDCARPLTNIHDIEELIMTTTDIGTLYHLPYETVKLNQNQITTLDRNNLYMVSTPQYFKAELIKDILNNKNDFTDELQIFEKDYEINFVKESSLNIKLTTQEDLDYIKYKLINSTLTIGHSYDFHPFTQKRNLVLGGIHFNDFQGLAGHSDADSLYHAVAESIIGALNMGDIGTLFPDNNPLYKGLDSSYFLKEVTKEVEKRHLQIKCIDAIIYIEKPKLEKYKQQMALNIKNITKAQFVNIKATTMEKEGLVGEEKGIGCEAVCLVEKGVE